MSAEPSACNAPVRRLGVTAAALALAAMLLRPQLAGALVVRGDECLYRAAPAQALQYYHRALQIDDNDGLALDRVLFVGAMVRRRDWLATDARAAVFYLRRHPTDSVVRLDRAIALRVLGRNGEAMRDFAEVGRRERDARAFVFAGLSARAIGDVEDARTYLRAALALNANLPVARRSLSRLERTQ